MNQRLSSRSSQRGVALIVTLVILVVVTFMGLVAMRMGMLHVVMSTNSQVNSLLFQNADAGTTSVLAKITATDPTVDPSNPINKVRDNPGTEIKGCLKSTGITFAAGCTSSDFISGRGAVVVQVGLVVPKNSSGEAQTVINYGTDAGVLPGGNNLLVTAYATSVLPAFGSASATSINDCFANYVQDNPTTPTSTVTGCMVAQNASFDTVVQEFSYGYPGY